MRIFQWIAIAGMTIFFPISALAINLGQDELGVAGTNAGIDTAAENASLPFFIGSIIGVILNILGALLFIYFVYSGFLWMTAQGDPKQITKAQDIMKNATIGLIITLAANSLVFFIAWNVPQNNIVWTQSTSDVQSAAGLSGTNFLLENNIGMLMNVALNLLGVVLFLIFAYAGFLWMTAQGDTKQVDKAKMMMRNAVIGLIITLLSRMIAQFVIDNLVTAQLAYVYPEVIHNVFRT